MIKLFNILKSWWMKFAHALGWFNTRVLLIITYVVMIAFPAIFFFVFRIDLLKRKKRQQESYWIDKTPLDHSVEQAKHQF